MRYVLFVVISLLVLTSCQSSSLLANDAGAQVDATLGLYYLRLHDFRAAEHSLSYALQQAPRDPLVWEANAYFADRQGFFSRANQDYHQALAIAPHVAIGHNNYGVFLCRHHFFKLALQQFQLAVEFSLAGDVERLRQNAKICMQKNRRWQSHNSLRISS